MEFDHPFEKLHLSFDDVQKLLTGRGRRSEANEVNGMAGAQRVADLALRLEAPMPGPSPARGSTTRPVFYAGQSRPRRGRIRKSE